MKLAWIHVNGPRDLREEAIARLAYVSDAFLSVSTPVQHAAATLINGRGAIQRQVQDRLRENGRAVEAVLGDLRRAPFSDGKAGGTRLYVSGIVSMTSASPFHSSRRTEFLCTPAISTILRLARILC